MYVEKHLKRFRANCGANFSLHNNQKIIVDYEE